MSADLTLTASVAFGNNPGDASPTMVPLTGVEQVKWQRGRSYEQDQIQPGTGSVTLDNTSGDLTPGNPTSSHYPNVTSEKLATITVTPPAPYDATAYPAHTGETTAWPTTFPGQGFGYAQTVMTTVDVMDALSLVDLESTYAYAVKASSPAGYWILDDGEGSGLAGNHLPGGDPVGFVYAGQAGGVFAFGQPTFATANPSDPSTSLLLSPATTTVGAVTTPVGGFGIQLPSVATVGSPNVPWACEFLTAGYGQNANVAVVMALLNAQGTQNLEVLATNYAGSPCIAVLSSDLGLIWFSSPTNALVDGAEHHIVIRWDGSTIRVQVDGNVLGTGSGSPTKASSPSTWSRGTGPTWVGTESFGGGSSVNAYGGRIGHLAWYNADPGAAAFTGHRAAAGGFPEPTGGRIARILSMAGDTAPTNIDTGASLTGPLVSGGVDAATLIQATCDTEQGQFFIAADGTRTFHSRHHRLNRGPKLYLSGDVTPNLSPDPSFERGLGTGSPWTGWTIALRTTIGLASTPTPADGVAVLTVTRTVTTGTATHYSPLIPVPLGADGTTTRQPLTVQVAGQSTTGTPRSHRIILTCYDAHGTALATAASAFTAAPTGSWTVVSATLTCPAGTVTAGWESDVQSLPVGEIFALDRNRLAVEATPAAWSPAQGSIEPDLAIEIDRDHIVNDLTYTLPSGSKVPRSDQTSITKHRRRKKTAAVGYTSLSDAQGAAAWYLYRYSQPQTRIETITLDLLTQPWLYPLVMPLEFGDRVQLVGLPGNSLPTTDFWVESLDFSLSETAQTVTLTLGNADTSPYFTLDDPIFGVLDAGNYLAA